VPVHVLAKNRKYPARTGVYFLEKFIPTTVRAPVRKMRPEGRIHSW
jgi:hypothetical protein